jgi:ATP-binding cassette subfamily B protein
MALGGFWGPAGVGGGSLGGGPRAMGAPGLPFAGVPEELQDEADRVLATEPRWPEPTIGFAHTGGDTRPLTFVRILATQRRTLLLLAGLVVAETLTLQAGPALTQIGIDDGIAPRHLGVLVAAGVAAVVAVVATILLGSARVSLTGRLAARGMEDLRLRVFAHLQRLSLDFYTSEKAGVILTRMTSDIEALQQFLQDGIGQFAVQGLTMVMVTAILFTYDLQLVALSLVLVVLPLALLSGWFRVASDRGYARVRDGIAAVLGDLAESLQGIRIIAGHDRGAHDVVRHRGIVAGYRDANDHTARIAGLYGPSTELVGVIGQAVVLVVGAGKVSRGELTIGELAAFLLYLNVFSQPVQQLVQVYNLFQQAQAAVLKLRDLLAVTPSVPERPGAGELPPIAGEVELEGVTFGYDPAVPVIHDVDLRIGAGETVALVGPTGAGKSTVAKLVVRFYDPQAGRVLIDGHDLRAVTLRSLRRQLGVVPQEPFLFSGSVADNLRFARPDATGDELDEAVERLGLAELVARLPQGLDTPVHERGVSLSAGERQLIALGRTFVARPRVVVLDEATSNLDLLSERRVETALDVLLEGRTAILIAHRLSTAMRADRVVLVDGGGIVEQGAHRDLVRAGGPYAELFRAWAAGAATGAARVGAGDDPPGRPAPAR